MQLKQIFPLPLLILATMVLLLVAALACGKDATPTVTERRVLDTAKSTATDQRALDSTTTHDPSMKETTMNTCQPSHMTPDDPVAHAKAIRHKYEPLFRRQPNFYAFGVGLLRDENDELTSEVGFKIYVTEKVDQSTLPLEDRIPGCLEGVPVQIRVGTRPRPKPEIP